MSSGFADIFQRFAGDHRANAIVREQLAQQGAILFETDQMHPANAGPAGSHGTRQVAIDVG